MKLFLNLPLWWTQARIFYWKVHFLLYNFLDKILLFWDKEFLRSLLKKKADYANIIIIDRFIKRTFKKWPTFFLFVSFQNEVTKRKWIHAAFILALEKIYNLPFLLFFYPKPNSLIFTDKFMFFLFILSFQQYSCFMWFNTHLFAFMFFNVNSWSPYWLM